MSIKRVVPDISSERIDESRTFYTELLGFDIAMDMGWVVTLASPENPTAQITLLKGPARMDRTPACPSRSQTSTPFMPKQSH